MNPEQYFLYVIEHFNRPDLMSAADFRAWRLSTLAALSNISKTRAGMILLRGFRTRKEWVRISPTFGPSSCRGSFINQAKPIEIDSPGTHGGTIKRSITGTVQILPSDFAGGSACYKKMIAKNSGWDRGFSPEEILFHELVHAYLRTPDAKRKDDELKEGLLFYGEIPEFYAVVLTNIYISDVTNHSKTGLRADWKTFRPLEDDLSTSSTFFASGSRVYELMNSLATDRLSSALCAELAGVDAGFNPLRELRDHKDRAKAQSQSFKAVVRDKYVPAVNSLSEKLAAEALHVLNAYPILRAL